MNFCVHEHHYNIQMTFLYVEFSVHWLLWRGREYVDCCCIAVSHVYNLQLRAHKLRRRCEGRWKVTLREDVTNISDLPTRKKHILWKTCWIRTRWVSVICFEHNFCPCFRTVIYAYVTYCVSSLLILC